MAGQLQPSSIGYILFSNNAQADRLFRRVLLYVSLTLLAILVLLPLIKLPESDIMGTSPLPSRYVELLLEAAPEELDEGEVAEPEPEEAEEEPAPEDAALEEETPAEAPEPIETEPEIIDEPEVEPQVSPDERATAREQAQQSGIMTLTDELADLRDLSELAEPSNSELLEAGSSDALASASAPGDTITSSAVNAGSSGISGTRSREVTSTNLASRSTTRVKDPITGLAPRTQSVQGNNPKAKAQGRSDEEIILVFSRHQGSFYRHYNRARRVDDELQGKVVLKFTIAPNGSITELEIVSSELDHEELEAKILTKVRTLNFGAKDVPPITKDFVLHFYPT